jgi:hypothetical protein
VDAKLFMAGEINEKPEKREGKRGAGSLSTVDGCP